MIFLLSLNTIGIFPHNLIIFYAKFAQTKASAMSVFTSLGTYLLVYKTRIRIDILHKPHNIMFLISYC